MDYPKQTPNGYYYCDSFPHCIATVQPNVLQWVGPSEHALFHSFYIEHAVCESFPN